MVSFNMNKNSHGMVKKKILYVIIDVIICNNRCITLIFHCLEIFLRKAFAVNIQ